MVEWTSATAVAVLFLFAAVTHGGEQNEAAVRKELHVTRITNG